MIKLIVLSAIFAVSQAAFLPRLSGRIVGGEDTTIEEHPHQLSLQYYGSHICGASILNENWAVTAAHCTSGVSSYSLTVMAGITNIDETGQKIRIRTIHNNPEYDPSRIDFDIALLELDRPLKFNEKAQPIALPEYLFDPAENSTVVTTGWGTTSSGNLANHLQAVTVSIVDRDVCREQYGQYDITERMICAGVAEGGKDACQGDSGGPLVGDGQLWGIVSWGMGCGEPNFSGVYSNVGNLRGYIRDITGI